MLDSPLCGLNVTIIKRDAGLYALWILSSPHPLFSSLSVMLKDNVDTEPNFQMMYNSVHV